MIFLCLFVSLFFAYVHQSDIAKIIINYFITQSFILPECLLLELFNQLTFYLRSFSTSHCIYNMGSAASTNYEYNTSRIQNSRQLIVVPRLPPKCIASTCVLIDKYSHQLFNTRRKYKRVIPKIPDDDEVLDMLFKQLDHKEKIVNLLRESERLNHSNELNCNLNNFTQTQRNSMGPEDEKNIDEYTTIEIKSSDSDLISIQG